MNFVLGGEAPMLAINPRKTKSEKDEQKGFVNLLVGAYGMFRNPTSHEARIHWPMAPQDAEDIMSMRHSIFVPAFAGMSGGRIKLVEDWYYTRSSRVAAIGRPAPAAARESV